MTPPHTGRINTWLLLWGKDCWGRQDLAQCLSTSSLFLLKCNASGLHPNANNTEQSNREACSSSALLLSDARVSTTMLGFLFRSPWWVYMGLKWWKYGNCTLNHAFQISSISKKDCILTLTTWQQFCLNSLGLLFQPQGLPWSYTKQELFAWYFNSQEQHHVISLTLHSQSANP